MAECLWPPSAARTGPTCIDGPEAERILLRYAGMAIGVDLEAVPLVDSAGAER